MDSQQRDVQHFHYACGLRAPTVPSFGSDEDLQLRLDLIREEFEELVEAVEAGDLVETIDALCDIEYVVKGFAVAIGVDLEPFWEEVHSTNMKKASGPKREDGKQLKPEGWHPPQIRNVFARLYTSAPISRTASLMRSRGFRYNKVKEIA